jgi:hypothetical protein
LEDIDRRLVEDGQRLDRLPYADACKSCDAITHALKLVEDNISIMFSDVQALKEGQYHQAEQQHRRVYRIQQRWASLSDTHRREFLPRISSRTLVQERVTVTQTTQEVTTAERRMAEQNQGFRHLQDCLDWIQQKQIEVENTGYGNDLDSTRDALEFHRQTHQDVLQFRNEVTQCKADKNTLTREESSVYQQHLSKLESAYSRLMNTSSSRLRSLESLIEFMEVATREIIWLNEREEVEVSRDWSSRGLQLRDIEAYHKSLMRELESREAQFLSVQDKGEALVMSHHPASKTIEAYTAAMQTQWAWLLQLTHCLETHLKHAINYQQFYGEVKEAEQWISKQTQLLHTHYSRSVVGLDEGEKLIREIQEMLENLSHYESCIEGLCERSREVVPLPMRAQRHFSPLPLTALCSYKHLNMSVSKNERCTLLDNQQKVKWRVRNSTGQEGLIPSVCFVIPPPNNEAIHLAQTLKQDLQRLRGLWRDKQRQLKKLMIFATIEIVKTWDLTEFRSLPPSQPEAILRALNEDAEKLMSEYEPGDPQIQQLQEEMRACNAIFDQLSARLRDERVQPTATAELLGLLEKANFTLDQLERTLSSRIHEPLPQNSREVLSLLDRHKYFEDDLRSLEPDLERIQQQYHQLNRNQRTPEVETKLSLVVEKWEQLASQSKLYVDRLKASEQLHKALDELNATIHEHEKSLAMHRSLSSDPRQLNNTTTQLQALQSSMELNQPRIDHLGQDVMAIKQLVMRSKPGVVRNHPDVQKAEKEAEGVFGRWDGLTIQLSDRLRNAEAADENLGAYLNGHQSESEWLNSVDGKVQRLPDVPQEVSRSQSPEAQQVADATMNLYQEMKQKKFNMEEVNKNGGRFIKEVKIFEKRVHQYQETIYEFHPGMKEELSARPLSSGADNVHQFR